MNDYLGHKYSIDFEHVKIKSEHEIESHYVGRLCVYSNLEIPTERSREIIDEIERTLPKDLTADNFEESLYRALEEKGLRRFEGIEDHGPIGKIKYKQREKPVPQK